jgi:UDP-N-acetyl-D-glucosamine 4,6-dehydratase
MRCGKKGVKMKAFFRPSAWKRTVFFILSDTLLSLMTLFLSYNLRFNFQIPAPFLEPFWLVFGVLVALKVLFFVLLNHYKIVWRFFGFYDAKVIIRVHLYAYFSFLILFFLFEPSFNPFPRSVIIIDFFLSLIFIGALRASKRLIFEGGTPISVKPTLIIGANSKAAMMIQSALKGEIDYYPVAIVDDESEMLNGYIQNIRVESLEGLAEIIQKKGISAVIFAKKYPSKTLQTLTFKLNGLGVYEIKQVKLLGEGNEKLEDLSIEDLLARHPQDLDQTVIERFIAGKSVLITGAGGSIGSEIAKQCERFGATSLTLIDSSEYNLYQIGEQLPKAEIKLLNITNKLLLEEIFEKHVPDIVIHAAAYKHVPICESNQEMAVYNNVYGSKNVIDTSIKYGVQKVVLISTDKAVRPTNVMGATKRVSELYANNVNAEDTEIVAVRFGNVLGSSGSVIPKFKEQIEKGGPVTVTDPEITRYFMLISEACQLVLQAAAIAEGGELFILDMGEPVKIVDMARQMIRLYGKEDEVDIVFTGLRPGEKLYEELLLDEGEHETRYRSIFIGKPTSYDIEVLNKDIESLLETDDKITALQRIVPEFIRKV